MAPRAAVARRTALTVVLAGALCAGTVVPASAAEPAAASTSWRASLATGEAAGITTRGGTASLDSASAHLEPQDSTSGWTEGAADSPSLVPTGLLTLDQRTLDRPTSRIDSALDADLPEGTTASVDVRGKRANGNWTEWIPSTATGTDSGTVALPEPTDVVQGRLVLTGSVSDPAAEPVVRDLTLTAGPAAASTEGADTEALPLNYSVFATREGLVGGTTANGHKIVDRDHFVALPSRRALSPRDRSDYSVKVCAPNGRCAFAPVWDVGPWNTRDDYWNPGSQRQEWKDLPQGVPQAQAAYRDGYNGGKDQFGRKAVNPAGIDLGDGVFWDALGLKDNSQVSVDYLWTGSVRLSKVAAVDDTESGEDGIVAVRSAPDAAAKIVGIAAENASVPVQCLAGVGGSWLRIGTGQFITAAAVPGAGDVTSCLSGQD
ncbi:MAG: hypothetical protein OJJ54_20175 [Pseudonocardia sp.]|nr:hypothetical protein [Pseudonocardia sp.]